MFNTAYGRIRLMVVLASLAMSAFAAAHGLSVHHSVALACSEGTICPG